jgi:DNA-binding transcriptional LysR family regulator
VAHYFLVSARCGCFMQAARSLNIKATLLRKRLAQLEQQVRHVLFSYQGSGLVLSRDGQHLQAQLIALAHERRLPVLEQPLIRLAVAEPILHDILGRDLIALLRRNASVRLEIISSTASCPCKRWTSMWCCGCRTPKAPRPDRALSPKPRAPWPACATCHTSPSAIRG